MYRLSYLAVLGLILATRAGAAAFTVNSADFSGYTPVVTTILLFVPAGSWVTATATDPNGNTSEFSHCEQSK